MNLGLQRARVELKQAREYEEKCQATFEKAVKATMKAQEKFESSFDKELALIVSKSKDPVAYSDKVLSFPYTKLKTPRTAKLVKTMKTITKEL